MNKTIKSLEDFIGQAVLVKTTEQYPKNYYAGILEQLDDKIVVLSLWSNKNTQGGDVVLSPVPNFRKSQPLFGTYTATQRNKQKLRRERDPRKDLVLLQDKVVSIYEFTNFFENEAYSQHYKGYEI